MNEIYALSGIIIALFIEILLLKILIKKIDSEYLIGLITLILLVALCWISVYFTKLETSDEDILSQNGSIFTIIGAVFTAINAVVVIYLMIWLHKKETTMNLLPQITELNKNSIEILRIISTEIDYFKEKQFKNYEILDEIRCSRVHENYSPYKQEIETLEVVINKIMNLFTTFQSFKQQINGHHTIDLDTHREQARIIHSINEIIILNRPSAEYKKSFVDGNRVEAEVEEMIDNAKDKALASIDNMINILTQAADN